MNNFGERLKHIRKEKMVRQKELSNHLNIAVSTLSQYENDKRHPNFEILAKIAEFFNVSTDYLLGINESSTSTLLNNIQHVDDLLNYKISYYELFHKISEHLLVISKNNDQRSLEILHALYNAVASVGMDYTSSEHTHENIELILNNHLAHKEEIDQTLNKLFRHHIKFYSN